MADAVQGLDGGRDDLLQNLERLLSGEWGLGCLASESVWNDWPLAYAHPRPQQQVPIRPKEGRQRHVNVPFDKSPAARKHVDAHAVRLQDARNLAERRLVVLHVFQHVLAEHTIERLVVERQATG